LSKKRRLQVGWPELALIALYPPHSCPFGQHGRSLWW
jgi:hypothetical protein